MIYRSFIDLQISLMQTTPRLIETSEGTIFTTINAHHCTSQILLYRASP